MTAAAAVLPAAPDTTSSTRSITAAHALPISQSRYHNVVPTRESDIVKTTALFPSAGSHALPGHLGRALRQSWLWLQAVRRLALGSG